MNERMKFVLRLEQGERLADLCREFGISRDTGHRVKKRYELFGVEGLYDQSRAPRRIPHRTSEAVCQVLIEARQAHPTWGPKKLKAWLEENQPGVRIPAPSTIGEILKEVGLVKPRRRSRRGTAKPTDLRQPAAPNELWCADFKGEFRLGNRSYCYPLTVTDADSRYILCCEGLEGTKGGPAQTAFEITFREYGLPEAIRTDNGPPFGSTGLLGLTPLSAWWIRLGIVPERIEPASPHQNGQHERMHKTLKEEATRPAAENMLQQQERFDRFRAEFNEERPHEALGQRPPSSRYVPSERSFADALAAEPEYPLHDQVLVVSQRGCVRLPRYGTVYLAVALAGYPVGVREVDEGRWLVTFMQLDLGYFDPEVGFDPIVQ